MKKIILTLLMATLFANIYSQKTGQNIYYFKTVDDFFSGNKVYLGKFVADKDCGKFTMLDTVSGKTYKIKLTDSSYAGYGFDNNRRMFHDKVEKCFYTYISGNKNILMYWKGTIAAPSFDQNGEIIDGIFQVDDASWIYYVKNMNLKDKKYKFERMIEDNPKLLAQFEKEVKADKGVYSRNFLEIHKKYTKLYCDQLTK